MAIILRRLGLGNQRCMQGLVGCACRTGEEKGVNVVDKYRGIFHVQMSLLDGLYFLCQWNGRKADCF